MAKLYPDRDIEKMEIEGDDTADILASLRTDVDDANILAGIKDRAVVTSGIIRDIERIINITDYNLDTNEWTTSANKSTICANINRIIRSNLLAGGWDDTYAFANYLHDTGSKYTRLIFRCINRNPVDENECSEDDMNAVFAATSAPGIFTEEDRDILNAGIRGGGNKQVGGTIAVDLILLLRMKDLRTLAAAIQAVPYANIITWGNSKINRLSDCLRSFLGVGPEQTYLDVITNQIASIYYQGTAISTDSYRKISDWISNNPALAISISAGVVRYRELLSDASKRALMVLPDLLGRARTAAGGSIAQLLTTVWRSNHGVALIVMLSFYLKHADQVNDFVKTNAADVINTLSQVEENINLYIDTSKKAEVTNDLIMMMKGLKDNLKDEVITAGQREQLASILNNTAKAQVATVNRNIQLRRNAANRQMLTEAQQRLDAANNRLYLANANSVVAELAARPKKNRARGGKSQPQKSHTNTHKKVSLTKRPKKSLHSRKANVAKRSNKKH